MDYKKAQLKKLSILVLITLVITSVLVLAITNIVLDGDTPANNTITSNKSIEIYTNITSDNLKEVKFNWNGTNTTIYDNSSLILMYNFNNLSTLGENDTYVFDISGNGNNGTVINGTFNSTNFMGYGNYDSHLQFDGIDDSVLIKNFATPEVISVSFWIKVNNATHDFLPFFESANFKMKMRLKTDTHIRVEGKNSTGSSMNREFDNQLEFGNWSHFVGMINSTTISLYKNGELSGTWTFVGDLNTTVVNYSIMKPETLTRYINGSMDELRVFNKTLNKTEIKNLYFTNFKKYDNDSWQLYVNQSIDSGFNLNSTNLTDIPYTYFSCVTDYSDNENCTDINTITRTLESNIIISNFSLSIGNINTNFYGTNIHGQWFTNSTPTLIDTDDDGVVDSDSNVTWHKEKLLDSGIKNLRVGMYLNKAGRYSNSSDGLVNFTGDIIIYRDIIQFAYENDIGITLIASYMPTWLADNSSGYCTDLNYCPPNNETQFANIINHWINFTTNEGEYISAIEGVEIWNEPYFPTFFMGGLTWDNQISANAYVKMYNGTYDGIKDVYSTIDVGGCAGRTLNGTVASPNMINTFLSNMTTKIDFFSFHPYSENYIDTPMIVDIDAIVSQCVFHGVNCSRIIVSEWNVKNDTIKNKSSLYPIYAENFALTMMDSLNKYPSNISLINYQWSERFQYDLNYPEYPDKWHLVSEPDLDDELTIAYNTTKFFSTLCPAGATVTATESTTSDLVQVACKNGDSYSTIIINAGDEATNVTLDLEGTRFNTITDMEDGTNYSIKDYSANIGIIDQYEIKYLMGTENLKAYLKLNENTGTTAYDVSGNSNHGTISGATWNNDGILNTLTILVDYTLDTSTGVFELVGTDHIYEYLITNWGYDYDSQGKVGIENTEDGMLVVTELLGIIVLISLLGIMIFMLYKYYS